MPNKLPRRHFLFFVAIIVIAAITGAIGLATSPTLKENSKQDEILGAQEEQKKIALEINSQEKVFNYDVTYQENKNTFELLKMLEEQSETFTFGYDEYDFGVFITEFNELKSTSNEFWKFQINGQDSGTGVSDYTPKNGDKITFILDEVN